MAESVTVSKRDERWYWHTNRTLKAIIDRGQTLCARPKCGVDISHMRADATFCSPRCWEIASRRDQTPKKHRENPRSEARELGEFGKSGIRVPPKKAYLQKPRSQPRGRKGSLVRQIT